VIEPEPPRTITRLVRGRASPPRVPLEAAPPTPEQLARELADRVRWAAWNTKRSKLGQANDRFWRRS
jgi:hypothetical protein